MSVQEQITRLTNARNSIGSAITSKDKDVSVPAGAKLEEMAGYIGQISTNKLQDNLEVTSSDQEQTKTPEGDYKGFAKVTVKPYTAGALSEITVDSNGKITAGVQTAGYLKTEVTKEKQLTTQYGMTVTPSTAEQTAVSKGTYTTGDIKVAGDSNLVGGNIAKGVTIFGVTGTHEGGGTSTQTKSMALGAAAPVTVKPDSGYALSSVTPSIDSAVIKAGNIKKGATILGVAGSASGIPEAYAGYVASAEEQLPAQSTYSSILYLDNDSYVTVGFLQSGFSVSEYSEDTTEFKASGWYAVTGSKGGSSWTVQDWTSTPSSGDNYLNNGKYTDTVLTYGGSIIFPTAKTQGGAEITISTEAPTAAEGADGDVWVVLSS